MMWLQRKNSKQAKLLGREGGGLPPTLTEIDSLYIIEVLHHS